MAKNEYWAIKYKNGWINNHCFYLRADAICNFLDSYSKGKWAGKPWRWHKRKWGVTVVRVVISEEQNNGK